MQKNQQNSNNYFYNSINQINDSNKSYDINNNMNQNEYLYENVNFENNNYNYLNKNDKNIKKIRSKSGPRITSNNRFSHDKSHTDISNQTTPSCDKNNKKKIKKYISLIINNFASKNL